MGQPTGTVSLVFTDIEGSTRLLEQLGTKGYREALARHREMMRKACSSYQGYEVDYEGDAFFYAFQSAQHAVSAVSDVMEGLADGPIRIRVGIHTGEPEIDPPKYVGLDVHLAARIMSAAHGGQVVLSKATAELVEAPLSDLGEHRLKDIEGPVQIFQLGEERFPPLKTISNTNLPRPASSFVGREHELSEVLSKVEQGARLLTLTGPGGSGKTRLALEAATTLVPQYKAGVFWVGLAALRDPSLVTEQISQTLGAKDGLAGHIAERELLLLLDNLEQVIEAAPELSKLLESCPNLTLLCTSRELLRIRGEVEYAVPPLAEPEAVSLFCERAQLEATEEIAELCSRLDNLPLAVELAAARTKALTPKQILERLSQRLDLLKGGRDADPRQQTLRATIGWSYDLLSGEEQRLFRAISIFSGGCTLEAAEEVADADLDTLQSLLEKSLLRFSNSRYWMLETIREYATDCSNASPDAEVVRVNHAEWSAELVETADAAFEGASQSDWLDRMEVEHDNIRAALTFALERSDADLALRLAGSSATFWWVHGHFFEGRRWLEDALSLPRPHNLWLRAKALEGAANLATRHQKDRDRSRAIEFAKEALALSRELNDAMRIARALRVMANAVGGERDSERFRDLVTQCAALAREAGDRWALSMALNQLGYLALVESNANAEEAAELFEEARQLAEERGDRRSEVVSLQNLGVARLEQGWIEQAADLLAASLRLAKPLGFLEFIVADVAGLAAVAAYRGDFEVAAELIGGAEALGDEIAVGLDPVEARAQKRAVASIEEAIGPEPYAAAVTRGRARRLDDLLILAIGQSCRQEQ